MYKYRNISDFRQSLVLKGKRILLKPDDVVESDTELRSVFLEAVALETPTSAIQASGVTKKVDELQQRLDGLEKEKEELTATKSQEIYDTVDELNVAVKGLENKFKDLTGVVTLLKASLDGALATVNGFSGTYDKDKQLYIKRLEMLKSAVMTIEEEVFGTVENPQGK